MLEKGVIAPNALFEKLNPDIDAEYLNVKVGFAYVPFTESRGSAYRSDVIGRFLPKPPSGPLKAFDDARSSPLVLAVPTPTPFLMTPFTTFRAAD
jgi:hypothetical protein